MSVAACELYDYINHHYGEQISRMVEHVVDDEVERWGASVSRFLWIKFRVNEQTKDRVWFRAVPRIAYPGNLSGT